MTRSTSPFSLLLWLLPVGIVLVATGCDFLLQPPKAQTPLEAQGRHVLQIASACGCHGANFAGWKPGRDDTFPRAAPFGERFVGDFGSVPASNITPDEDTGISGWSDAQLERLLREGIDPAENRISPLMPYHAYHGMARSDMRALIAYLRRLQPVKNTVPEKSLAAPPPDEKLRGKIADARPTEPVALGRYLVHHVCACTDCHASGARSPEGEVLAGKMMRMGGGSIAASNLTPDRRTGIGKWSGREIAHYLRTGTRPDGGLAQGPMAGLILTSFGHLTAEEANAIAAYLKSVPPVSHRPDVK